MMTAAMALLILRTQPPRSFAPGALTFNGQAFIYHGKVIPTSHPTPAGATSEAFRRDNVFVVWDARGLTIRRGKHVFSTTLRGIPVSPRLRDRADIQETIHLAHVADLRLDATALSGARRIGKNLYLLPRWQNGPGRTWLEALIKIDLSLPDPRPEALQVLPGITFSSASIEDNLLRSSSSLIALIHRGSQWSRWSFALDHGTPRVRPIGDGIKFAKAVAARLPAQHGDGVSPSGTLEALYIEKSGEGFRGGEINLVTLERQAEWETTALPRFIDVQAPAMALTSNDAGEASLLDVMSGETAPLPAPMKDLSVARLGGEILVWAGGASPTRAWIYRQSDLSVAAWWKR